MSVPGAFVGCFHGCEGLGVGVMEDADADRLCEQVELNAKLHADFSEVVNDAVQEMRKELQRLSDRIDRQEAEIQSLRAMSGHRVLN